MTTFNANQFTPTKWDTAEDKARICNRFALFVKADFALDKWINMVYEGIHQHLGFIAHYNRLGFYDEYFRSGPDQCRFLNLIVQPEPFGVSREWEDVSRALGNWLKESGEYERHLHRVADEIVAARYAQYQKLQTEFKDYQPPSPEPVQARLFEV